MFARAATLALLVLPAIGPISIAQPVANTEVPAVNTGPAQGTASGATLGTAARMPPGASISPALPVPTAGPRIAKGPDYDHCLAMLYNDPQGASAFAGTWADSGGGDGALHCQALAQIELGNVEAGAAMLEKLAATANAPDPARAAVFGQAVQAWMMANKPDRAFDAATLALTLAPNDAALRIDRATVEGSMQRYHEAIDDLDRALAIDPRRAEAFVLRASAWRHLNNLEVAGSDIEHALAIDPDNADALLERGILRQRTGNLTGARADWQHAINLDPNSTTADLAQQDLALLEAGPTQGSSDQ
jgi:tetratricopeptide (TPR) repeat protein